MNNSQEVTPKELKTILPSKRSYIYYLEKCSVLQKDGRIVYLTSDANRKDYYNIPIANTTILLLGMGTSITQNAVRMLSSAGVPIGFCGTGGTPLLAGSEPDMPDWMLPQSEYRITKYMQGWVHFWFDDEKRLEAARFSSRSASPSFRMSGSVILCCSSTGSRRRRMTLPRPAAGTALPSSA